MVAEAEAFIRAQGDRPFFLFLPFIEPHVALQPPKESVERFPATRDRGSRALGVYDIESDPGETVDLAASRADLIAEGEAVLRHEVADNPVFPVPLSRVTAPAAGPLPGR